MFKDYRQFLLFGFQAILMLLGLPFGATLCNAGQTQTGGDLPAIAIIIDDLGNGYERDKRALLLPGKVSYAFLPHTRYTAELAELAYAMGKDVLLHLPMQSTSNAALGPGALTMEMNARQLRQTLFSDLAAVPHAIGINNHMGSLLTQHPGAMQWLMQAIADTGGLFFVDSFTVSKSVAYKIAAENWIPNLKRDVFLDTDRSHAAVREQFYRLLAIARKKGIALAIGHPYPETLAVLETLLPTLPEHGVRLAPVSQLIKMDSQRIRTWRAYLSH
jgi:polysaccharide deacetylase 2 family uncharacterized protein YibQ